MFGSGPGERPADSGFGCIPPPEPARSASTHPATIYSVRTPPQERTMRARRTASHGGARSPSPMDPIYMSRRICKAGGNPHRQRPDFRLSPRWRMGRPPRFICSPRMGFSGDDWRGPLMSRLGCVASPGDASGRAVASSLRRFSCVVEQRGVATVMEDGKIMKVQRANRLLNAALKVDREGTARPITNATTSPPRHLRQSALGRLPLVFACGSAAKRVSVVEIRIGLENPPASRALSHDERNR